MIISDKGLIWAKKQKVVGAFAWALMILFTRILVTPMQYIVDPFPIVYNNHNHTQYKIVALANILLAAYQLDHTWMCSTH